VGIKSSKLFKSLNDLRKYENVFRDAYDIYFYISGYDRAILLSETNDENEEWVYSFLVFIRERLHDMYEPKGATRLRLPKGNPINRR
jgi:hypothetical protein